MLEIASVPLNAVILKRPQYNLVGKDLFFLISKHPFLCLSESEAKVWASLGEETQFEELHSKFSTQLVDSAIKKFVELGICDVAASSFPKNRRRVLVIEPHSDDAALGVGGTMWLLRNTCEFTIATIGSRSNFTSYYNLDREFFDIDKVTNLRIAEGEMATRLLGGRYIPLGLLDGPLRYHYADWSLDWFREHQFSVLSFNERSYCEAELKDWIAAIRKLIHEVEAEEIWMPLGIGSHCDHQLARDACLSVLLEQPSLIKEKIFKFYQDVPYAFLNPTNTEFLLNALKSAGTILVPDVSPIEDVFNQKLRLISVYASQFMLNAIRSDIEKSAQQASVTGGKAELLWRIEKIQDQLDVSSLYAHQKAVEKTAQLLSNWLRRFQKIDQIKILLVVPTGRWKMDREILFQYFPNAIFDIYASPPAALEVSELHTPRINLHYVSSEKKVWGLLALKLMAVRPKPTLIVSGEKGLNMACIFAAFLSMKDIIVVSSMDHFIKALQKGLTQRP
jgi:LmbE family N-acetylglucosaminyl deacetylase